MIFRPLALPAFARPTSARAGSAVPRRRVARRAVLWCAAVTLLVNVGLAVVLETVLPQLLDPEYGYLRTRAAGLQRSAPNRRLVLALGSSRTQNALDPAALGFPDAPGEPLVVNAGRPGAWPVSIRLDYHRHVAAGVRPAAVLVEVLPAYLSFPGPAEAKFPDDPGCPDLTVADLCRLVPYLTDPAPLLGRWARHRAGALPALQAVAATRLGPGWETREVSFHQRATEQFGFVRSPYQTLADEIRAGKLAETREGYEGSVRHIAVSELSDRAYRDLVADCRAAGTPVAFFMTPESPVFRSWYTPQSRAAVAAYARVLSDELGCPVFAAPLDYAEEDFADGHHMLSGAARRFSRQLADHHLKPWLAAIR